VSTIGSGSSEELRRFGDAALIVECPSPEAAQARADAIREATLSGVLDVVGGFDSVVVIYNPRVIGFEVLAPLVATVRARPGRADPKTVVLATCFDGPDLAEVAAMSGLGRAGVQEALLGATLRVSVMGFAPGFAYLSGLPEALVDLPRRATPRPSVPAGSFALAGGHAAVYPQATPAGGTWLAAPTPFSLTLRRRRTRCCAPGMSSASTRSTRRSCRSRRPQ
jgi:KipI family sensor histidine kinase inhibitor